MSTFARTHIGPQRPQTEVKGLNIRTGRGEESHVQILYSINGTPPAASTRGYYSAALELKLEILRPNQELSRSYYKAALNPVTFIMTWRTVCLYVNLPCPNLRARFQILLLLNVLNAR